MGTRILSAKTSWQKKMSTHWKKSCWNISRIISWLFKKGRHARLNIDAAVVSKENDLRTQSIEQQHSSILKCVTFGNVFTVFAYHKLFFKLLMCWLASGLHWESSKQNGVLVLTGRLHCSECWLQGGRQALRDVAAVVGVFAHRQA